MRFAATKKRSNHSSRIEHLFKKKLGKAKKKAIKIILLHCNLLYKEYGREKQDTEAGYYTDDDS